MRNKSRLFITLWLAGFIGILSFLLVDLNAFIDFLPAPEGGEFPHLTPAVKLLSVVQPAILLALAVWAGVTLSPKVGLSAPVITSWTAGRRSMSSLQPLLLPGLLGGLGGGMAIVLISILFNPWLHAEAEAQISALGQLLPLTTRVLYGGITEELLMRWGLMTLLVWGLWRGAMKRHPQAPAACYHAAIIISAVIFGIGHLPLAFLIMPDATFALIAYVIIANSAFGVVAGYLYWKRGLEAAIIAHMIAHVVMFTAIQLGV